jgi:hypothetical protein
LSSKFYSVQEGGVTMKFLPRVSLGLLVLALVLVSILLGPLGVSPASADVGAQPILPDGSDPKPEHETPVVMQAEKVTLNVRKATEADNTVVKLNPQMYALNDYPVWYPAVAEVRADFIMKNPTNEPVSMTVWFPLASALVEIYSQDEIVPRIESLQVLVHGNAVDYSVIELSNPQGEDRPMLPWASFPVTFPASEEVPIRISYILPAQLPMNTYLGVGMVFNYIFQTGAGWADPIGKAELVVNLPYPASAETIVTMPEGGQVDGQQLRWTWENLEPGPQDDFSILLIKPERWEELQVARAAVKSKPGEGQAWLKLCGTYHALGLGPGGSILPGFGETYQPMAVQACQEAARLLPGDAAPHYGLAALYLSVLSQDSSPGALQPVLDELKIGQELEVVQPPSEVFFYNTAWYSSMSEYITDVVGRIFGDAAATAETATGQADAIIATSQASKEAELTAGKPAGAYQGRAGVYFTSAFTSGKLEVSRLDLENRSGGRALIFGSQRWLDVTLTDINGKQIKDLRGFVYVYFNLNSDDRAAWNKGNLSIYQYKAAEKDWVRCPTFVIQDKSAQFGRATCLITKTGLYSLATTK